MPKREDIRTILVLGSGPIVIGQGCEFDYSGAQACKALRAEGCRVVLVNSNPATIMTDPSFSDRTYIEPITPESVRKIIQKEFDRDAGGQGIDAILPTLGGQTALNCACALFDNGTLDEFGIEMIGADRQVIHRAEDREAFREVCESQGLPLAPSRTVTSLEEAMEALQELGLPSIVRPAFTLGGWGGGVAYNTEEFRQQVARGLAASMIGQVQIDKSLLGWKEFELEVVRDRKDNCVIVCGIENIDAMGVHTGDSITVAPILTLTDKEYQVLRDAAFAVVRAVGVETGGSNVQFAVNPSPAPTADGSEPFEFVVVEMNPRVSRSSALASKATGFPIAKIAARLALGYTLDELRNDITATTSACFEPSIDYVVTKMPRWTFEKFPEADETLTTQMKSVGEAMAIGRTFKESLQKAIRSMEVKRFGLGLDRNDKWLTATRAIEREQLVLDFANPGDPSHEISATGLRTADGQPIEWPIDDTKLTRKLAVPSQGRLYYVRYAMKMGWSIERIHEHTKIDPFFLGQIAELVRFEDVLLTYERLEDVPEPVLRRAKQLGYSDAQLANVYLDAIRSETILSVREHRLGLGIEPVFKLVDTCAAEFEAATPYYYSTYEEPVLVMDADGQFRAVHDSEVRVTETPKVVILGGGPNRIGQGIEFDYCCCHAAFAARDLGFESVMINSNPETVSTDYDTSDLLFFEPLTLEDVLNVTEALGGRGQAGGKLLGTIVQFGGQTPLNLAHGLVTAGTPIIGTSMDSIDLAEDRDHFDRLLEKLELSRPASGIARSRQEAETIAAKIGYPVLVRPSYVLGGRGMEICQNATALRRFVDSAVRSAGLDGGLDDAPILIDKFLDGATEVDVDVIADFDPSGDSDEGRAVVCGIMEHIEHAGVHSGDSTCFLPPNELSPRTIEAVRDAAMRLARALRVRGLMNVQLAIKDGVVYVLEVNPRASRTAPYVSKATHVSWPNLAARVMMGASLDDLGVREVLHTGAFAVKAPVFPHQKFPRVDFVLGPEMRSTGEVMGMDASPPLALAKAAMASGNALPTAGAVFVSVRDADKPGILPVVRGLAAMGFVIYSTGGTAEFLSKYSVRTNLVQKIATGARPNVVDMMTSGDIHLVINTPTASGSATDEGLIRSTAVRLSIPMITTATAARAAVDAIAALRAGDWSVRPLQEYEAAARRAAAEGQAMVASR
ncbi:MAG: carbamoyl-phosphate synthase large subunit [Phycisphaerales bacterium]